MVKQKQIPYIVNIKENSLDDGPGIRSVVFFKGCPLSCVWCQNPEAQNSDQELIFEPEKCIKCPPSCFVQCPNSAFNYDMMNLDREKCTLTWECVNSCPAKVFSIAGRRYMVEELMNKFVSDMVFYQNSNGGITLSGGEPMIYPEYVLELVTKLQEKKINVTIETCGYFKLNDITREILRKIQYIYFDIKLINPEHHKMYCRVDNNLILENLKDLIKKEIAILPTKKSDLENAKFKPFLIPRIPLIPEIVMNQENLTGIAQFLQKLGVKVIDLLPYNPLWTKKSITIGKKTEYTRKTWLKPEEKSFAAQFFQDFTFDTFKV